MSSSRPSTMPRLVLCLPAALLTLAAAPSSHAAAPPTAPKAQKEGAAPELARPTSVCLHAKPTDAATGLVDGEPETLRWAVEQANADPSCDTIYLLPGEHVLDLCGVGGGDPGGNSSGDLDVTDALVIYGDGPAHATVRVAGCDNRIIQTTAPLTLRGATFRDGSSSAPGGCVHASGQDALVLDDVAMQGCHSDTEGGAVLGRHIEVRDSSFTGNTAGVDIWIGYGGAIRMLDTGTLDVSDSKFWDNHATNCGGAIDGFGPSWTFGHEIQIRGSVFTSNSVLVDGGAVLGRGISIEDSVFSRNAAGALGGHGGAVNAYIRLEVSGSTFEDNSVEEGGYSGGALFSLFELNVTDSTFRRNSADRRGGAVAVLDLVAVADIERSTFEENTAGWYGGAIDLLAGGDVTGSTFIDNHAGIGGGAIHFASSETVQDLDVLLEVSNSTLAYNSAGWTSSAIHPHWAPSVPGDSVLSLRHVTIHGDGADTPLIDGPAVVTTFGSFLGSATAPVCGPDIAASESTGGNHVTAPGCSGFAGPGDLLDQPYLAAGEGQPFGALGLHGGPTPTFEQVPDVLFDRIPKAWCASAFDQRGTERPQYGKCDVGAVERPEPPITDCCEEDG